MEVQLLLDDPSGTKMYIPSVEEGIEWSTERRGAAGKLTFRMIPDDTVPFSEGTALRLQIDGQTVFYGYVFTCKRTKDRVVSVTAYDQLRYLKNKDTYVYENMTASELIRRIAADFALKVGVLEDSGFVIASRVEENTPLFDMIGNALDLTMQNSKKMFVLYDDAGMLTLKNLENMYVGEPGAYLMIDETSGENFDYTSSIDTETYNQIKLVYGNEDRKKEKVYTARDAENIGRWGVLQYFDTVSEGENGQAKADALLQLYNRKTRNLQITNAFGDARVRAGSLLVVNLDLGDVKLKNFMLVEKVKHCFKKEGHFMDLTLRGGEFIA